jgi:hypothetical protein
MPFEIITHPQGDHFARAYAQLKDEFDVPATDLTSWNFVATVKAAFGDADSAALLTLTTAQMNVNNTTLEVGVVFTPTQLAALTLGTSYYYVCKARTPGGIIGTLEECLFCLIPSARQVF